ncbi:hypothetical protein GF406_03575 [candidate division KSB1 bacterium]|nr:hypothetical protein [candidate division KSB1 bacterium]
MISKPNRAEYFSGFDSQSFFQGKSMNRRSFLTISASSLALPVLGSARDRKFDATRSPELYEWRQYQILPGAGKKRFETFIKDAALPAWNRFGISPVGVFKPVIGSDSLNLYILLVHNSIHSVMSLENALANDAEYLSAGQDILQSGVDNPAILQMNSWLLTAFSHYPRVQKPAFHQLTDRIYELRIYKSPTEMALDRKIAMFNQGSTIDLFQKLNLHAIFYGKTVIGHQQPSLIYMMAFRNLEDREASWKRFGRSSEWELLRKDDRFIDSVSSTSKLILCPTEYSQI